MVTSAYCCDIMEAVKVVAYNGIITTFFRFPPVCLFNLHSILVGVALCDCICTNVLRLHNIVFYTISYLWRTSKELHF